MRFLSLDQLRKEQERLIRVQRSADEDTRILVGEGILSADEAIALNEGTRVLLRDFEEEIAERTALGNRTP